MEVFTLEFSIECPASASRAELVADWFRSGLRELSDGLLDRLETQGPLPADGIPMPAQLVGGALASMVVMPRKGSDGPGTIERYSAMAFQRFENQFDSDFSRIGLVAHAITGPWSVSTPYFELRCQVIPEVPDYMHLVASVSQGDFEVDGTAQKWLRFAARQADALNPIFGHSVSSSEDYRTSREKELRWFPFETVPNGRRSLRGYSWITICSREIIEQLGGIQELVGSGAFHCVRETVSGGAVLQASETYADYLNQSNDGLASVLGPVLFA